jgi:hypothetical protein
MSGLDDLIHDHCVSLKVCELCGRLFCRNAYGDQYCTACEVELREFPPIGSRKLRGRKADPQSARQKAVAAKSEVRFLAKPLAGVFDEEI